MVRTWHIGIHAGKTTQICSVVKFSPSSGCVPPRHVQHDPSAPDVFKDGYGLGVGHPLERESVHGENLVPCGKEERDIWWNGTKEKPTKRSVEFNYEETLLRLFLRVFPTTESYFLRRPPPHPSNVNEMSGEVNIAASRLFSTLLRASSRRTD